MAAVSNSKPARPVRGDLTVILDDAAGRRAARDRALPFLGSAGVVVLAKQQGAISLVRPILDELLSAGLYLGGDVYRRVLSDVGE